MEDKEMSQSMDICDITEGNRGEPAQDFVAQLLQQMRELHEKVDLLLDQKKVTSLPPGPSQTNTANLIRIETVMDLIWVILPRNATAGRREDYLQAGREYSDRFIINLLQSPAISTLVRLVTGEQLPPGKHFYQAVFDALKGSDRIPEPIKAFFFEASKEGHDHVRVFNLFKELLQTVKGSVFVFVVSLLASIFPAMVLDPLADYSNITIEYYQGIVSYPCRLYLTAKDFSKLESAGARELSGPNRSWIFRSLVQAVTIVYSYPPGSIPARIYSNGIILTHHRNLTQLRKHTYRIPNRYIPHHANVATVEIRMKFYGKSEIRSIPYTAEME